MYIELCICAKSNTITGKKRGLFGKIKNFSKKVKDYTYCTNHQFIIKEADIDSTISQFKEDLQDMTIRHYKHEHKRIIEISSDIEVVRCVSSLDEYTIDELLKLLTPQQFKEQYGELKLI